MHAATRRAGSRRFSGMNGLRRDSHGVIHHHPLPQVLAVGDELHVDGVDLIHVLPGHVVEEQELRGAVAASSLARSLLEPGFFSQKNASGSALRQDSRDELNHLRSSRAFLPIGLLIHRSPTSSRNRSSQLL
jgi:hypothetical protein